MRRSLLVALGLSPLLTACLVEGEVSAPDDEDALDDIEATASLTPSRDVWVSGAQAGNGDVTSLYSRVNDGTDATYVRSASGAQVAQHTTGYSGPAGTVTGVTVRVRADAGSGAGTVQVVVLDGTTQVAATDAFALNATTRLFSQSFTGLSVSSVDALRTRVVLRRTDGGATTYVRYSEIALDVTTGGGSASTFTPGVYVPTFGARISTTPLLTEALQSPSVDGVYIAILWNDIETSPGNYDFSRLAANFDAAIAAGKKVSFSIRAGAASPSYVCQNNPLCVRLTAFTPVTRQCKTNTVPMPWDTRFQTAWRNLLDALDTYFATRPDYYRAISHIKITGVNNFTDEVSLPYEPLVDTTYSCSGASCPNGTCTASGAVAKLRSVGYTTTKVRGAWDAITDIYQQNFPDKLLDMQAIPKGFLKISTSDDPALTLTLIDDSAAKFAGGFIVQSNGLSTRSGTQPPSWASIPNVIIGNQMLKNVYGDPGCQMSGGTTPCTESVLRTSVDNGIAKGVAFLEIYAVDVIHYPNTTRHAHDQLAAP